MPKVDLNCEHCGAKFSVFPSAIKHAEARGTRVRFCSTPCRLAAKASGAIAGRPKRGATISCAVCSASVYREPGRLQEGRVYLCSEQCRLVAHEKKLIDRAAPRPNRKRGEEINCRHCGVAVYRKKSMIDRRIAMTCGEPVCISAYARSLWGLPPLTEKQASYKKGPARRATNFTATQRVAWLDNSCVRCGATENLSLDHIIPVAAGGASIKENAQTLCQPCNIKKSVREDRQMAKAFRQSQSGG